MARQLSELRKSVDYLAQSAIADFMDEVHGLMADGRITQGEVADRTGWKPSYISRILRGETNLTLKTMARLAAALDTSVRVHLAPEGVLVEWVEKTPEEIAGAPVQKLVKPRRPRNVDVRLGEPGRGTIPSMNELVFEITQEADGGFVAECLTEAVFTQADTWAELRDNVREALKAFFADAEGPATIRLHLVRDEVLATG